MGEDAEIFARHIDEIRLDARRSLGQYDPRGRRVEMPEIVLQDVVT